MVWHAPVPQQPFPWQHWPAAPPVRPQGTEPLGQRHCPALHDPPAGQALPQVPQFEPSPLGSVHLDPHTMGLVAGQVHTFEMQLAPVAHTLVQAPQFDASVAVFTHSVSHSSGRLAGHAHWPFTQMSLVCGHAGALQPPQWWTSVWVFVQKVRQSLGLGARHWHEPVPHWDPGFSVAQRWPQLPQLSGSTDVSTHCGESGGSQDVVPGSQSHDPAVHVPRPQAWPQVPQFSELLRRSTHAPLHTSGASAGQAHAPASQVAPVGHRWPGPLQLPQWPGSAFVSTQTPLQRILPPLHSSPPPDPAQPARQAARQRKTATRPEFAMPHRSATRERVGAFAAPPGTARRE